MEEDLIKPEVLKSSKLGITPEIANEIIEFISSHPVSAVKVMTGGGKSTAIPRVVSETGAKIFVSQPTIPAALGLYDYMRQSLGDDVVGFAAEGNIRYNGNTQIVYCTAGHLRNKMINYFKEGEIPSGDMSFCDVIMVDEAHNGTLDNDVIMEIWKYAANKGYKIPRMVLASATLSKEDTVFETLPLYEIDVPGYPVEIIYHDKNYQATDKSLYVDTAAIVMKYHINNPVPQDKVSKYIVFCAGKNEVDVICQILELSQFENLIVTPVHSKMEPDEIMKIKLDLMIGQRQIIVATNIAEASLTINGLDAVFDTLTEKIGETSKSGGLRLEVTHISKSSAGQRKGRTGRTNPGFCYRMCTEDFFETLEPQRKPEIFRVPLTDIIIHLLDAGLNPIKLFDGRISNDRIKKDLTILRMLKMIDKENKVSDLGHFAPNFPLSVRSSALIYQWSKLTNETGEPYPLFPIIALAVLIDSFGPSYFFYPKKSYDQTPGEYKIFLDSYYDNYFKQYKANTDLEVLLNFWNYTISQFETVKPSKKYLSKLNSESSFNNKKVTEVFTVINQCCKKLNNSYNFEIDIGIFNEKKVIEVALPILKEIYADSIYELRGSNYFNIKTGDYYKIDNKNILSREVKKPYQRIIAFNTAEIETKPGMPPIRYISLYQPI
jgi:HrpA-like RNA helicase